MSKCLGESNHKKRIKKSKVFGGTDLKRKNLSRILEEPMREVERENLQEANICFGLLENNFH